MMKRILIILLCFVSYALSASTYYVATTGSNSNPGTLAEPYLTIQYGINQLRAGDTLFIRSGTYNLTGEGYIDCGTYSGTAINPICVYGYPTDVLAGQKIIIDGDGLYRNGAMWVHDVDYWKFKDFTVCNAKQDGGTSTTTGIATLRCQYIYYTNIVVHDCGGYGFFDSVYEPATHGNIIYYTNCDGYNNYDSESEDPGNASYGIASIGLPFESDTLLWNHTYFTKCRAWNNSDGGLVASYGCYAEFDSCWVWNNGYQGTPDIGGDGIRMGLIMSGDDAPTNQYLVTNCISVYNQHSGFAMNCYDDPGTADLKWYNNTSAFNDQYGYLYNNGTGVKGTQITRNTISYNNIYGHYFVRLGMAVIHDHNSWDIPKTVSDADFISVDTTGITAARQVNGSFPDNDCYNKFLKLASTSDLINVGVDVGLTYVGIAPDLGADEYAVPIVPIEPVVIYTTGVYPGLNRALAGGNVNDDGGGTVSARGVCWSVNANPTTADSKTEDGTGTGTFISNITGLAKNTTYHVRAYATNEAGTAYGADVEFTTKKSSNATHGGKQLFSGGKMNIIQ